MDVKKDVIRVVGNKVYCPKCGDELEFCGSSCYPQDGVHSEHINNENCLFDIELKINHHIPNNICLRDTMKKIMKYIYG